VTKTDDIVKAPLEPYATAAHRPLNCSSVTARKDLACHLLRYLDHKVTPVLHRLNASNLVGRDHNSEGKRPSRADDPESYDRIVCRRPSALG
jgi:hypothetical protein